MRISSSPSAHAQAAMRSGRGAEPLVHGPRRPAPLGRPVVLSGAPPDLHGAPRPPRRPRTASAASATDSSSAGASTSTRASATTVRARIGERLVAAPESVVRAAGAQRLLAGGEGLVGWRSGLVDDRCGVAALDHDRAPAVLGPAARRSRARRHGARSGGSACGRTAPRPRPSRPPDARRRRTRLVLIVVVYGPRAGVAIWHLGSSSSRLTGLADGLAPKSGATPPAPCGRRFAPPRGSPASRLVRELSGSVRDCNTSPRRQLQQPATAVSRRLRDGCYSACPTALATKLATSSASSPVYEVRRHLAVAARAALLDRVEHERLRRAQLVEVRADRGDRVRAPSACGSSRSARRTARGPPPRRP